MKKRTKQALMSCAMLTMLLIASGCSLQGPIGPQGEQGVPGEKGDKGDPGADGKDGSRIHTGEGVPNNGVGSDGDLYVDTLTGDLYEKKGIVWTKTGNIHGNNGEDGRDGVSVSSIEKTGSEGKDDTYTITYSDGSTSQFVVKNGEDGSQGIQGVPGKDGHTPNITIGENGHWYVDGTDTGVPARGEKGDKGDKGDRGDRGQDGVTYVPCIFNNYDGTKLWEFYFERGTDVVYSGPTPTKPDEKNGEDVVKWTFVGWDKPLENVQKPVVFTARFECFLYDCTFCNYDGTVLQSCKVNRGDSAIYTGETPTKPDEKNGEDVVKWAFVGWDKPLVNITKDTVFTATFDAPNAIKCTFQNYDGSLLGYGYCGIGGNVAYKGVAPSKPDNDDGNGTVIRSEFIGWDKSLKNVESATTFTAQFAETTYYRCDFLNSDGSILESRLIYDGGVASYAGKTPTKKKTAVGTTVTEYSFKGWDKPLGTVSAPTAFTAIYSSTTFTGYRVDFLNPDGSLLYGDYFKQGVTAYCPSDLLPWSYDDINVTMFAGWDKSISNLSSAVKTKMRLRTISRSQNGEWPQTKETDETVISALRNMTPDSDGFYRYGNTRYLETDYSTWRKVEPIQWKVLSSDGGDIFVVSEKILASKDYNEYWDGLQNGLYANNYKNSEIRFWLNGEFLNRAFLDDSLIATTVVDNSPASTGDKNNVYACENTNDKVFLLSYEEATKAEYGFSNDLSRICKDSDGNEAWWWLRSPSVYLSYSVLCVNSSGGTDGSHVLGRRSARPALHFCFD